MRENLVDVIYSFNEEYRYVIYKESNDLYCVGLQQKVYDDYYMTGEMEFVPWCGNKDYIHKTDSLKNAYEIGNEGLRCLGGNHVTVKDMKCKWLEKFAPNISDADKDEHITSNGNYLWHIFSWNYVEPMTGDDARAEFENLTIKKIYGFNQFDNDEDIIKEYDGLTVDSIENELDYDIYLFDQSLKWTYVNTHETMCGPYFFNGTEGRR
ncbi:DUF4275 family protein [Clostridium sp. C8-1-8]|uniref:DUF4275 family protein n=1 Tax=Clostridium sp. C8-1-8 TaxID=2698831 RepID=UPI00136A07CD|nr:DUF4275 family protein [Clostridium sp. C8-1-8]